MGDILYQPKWATHEKDLHSDSLDKASKAAEAFTAERELELKTSEKARNYEKARKAEAFKNKPAWVKKQREMEQAPLKEAISELKKGASTKGNVRPMPGFVIVKPVVQTKTDAGIYLANEVNVNTNTGYVVRVGAKVVNLHEVVEPPFKEGDKVMFKKGLPGLEMSIKDEFCLLMTWSDVLGVFEEDNETV